VKEGKSVRYKTRSDLELLNVVLAEKFTESRNLPVADQLYRMIDVTR